MKSIKEIFATNPSLLEANEVKELIEQSRLWMQSTAQKHNAFRQDVFDILFQSDVFIINGISSNDVVKDLLDKVV